MEKDLDASTNFVEMTMIERAKALESKWPFDRPLTVLDVLAWEMFVTAPTHGDDFSKWQEFGRRAITRTAAEIFAKVGALSSSNIEAARVVELIFSARDEILAAKPRTESEATLKS